MKIPQSIGDIYDLIKPDFERLGQAVENRIRGRLDKEWHFVGRIKDRESFAIKIETGRVESPRLMEDFFACTAVVRTMEEVANVETALFELFELRERRPAKPNYASFDPSTFGFDHLRLYLRWRDDDALPATGLAGMGFEVQVKTYLQHAWGIATHDPVYKTDEVNWRKARIAYQVKAMLDHAEISIAQAGQLAAVPALQVENEEFDQIRSTIDALRAVWRDDLGRLPRDVRTLAENVARLLNGIGLNPSEMRDALESERAEGRGPLIETLSPFGVIVQSLLIRHQNEMREFLTGARRGRGRPRNSLRRLTIPAEITLPAGLERSECRMALFIDKS